MFVDVPRGWASIEPRSEFGYLLTRLGLPTTCEPGGEGSHRLPLHGGINERTGDIGTSIIDANRHEPAFYGVVAAQKPRSNFVGITGEPCEAANVSVIRAYLGVI